SRPVYRRLCNSPLDFAEILRGRGGHPMKRFLGALAAMGVLVGGGMTLAGVQAPAAAAQPCRGATVWGWGGSQGDGRFYQDGSFQRCQSLTLFGIGGWNCFIVPPPPRPI